MDGTTAHLLFGGDAMLGRTVNEVIHREGGAYPLEALADVTRTADLFLVNLECALSARALRYAGPAKAFYFRADPAAAETLRCAGVDLVSLANNHALDADYDGLRDTLKILDAYGIAHVGAGATSEDAARPVVLDVMGQRLGVLAWCDHQDDFNAGVDRPGIRYVDLDDADAVTGLIGEVDGLAQRVDHVLVSVHWQANWVPRVLSSYRSLARRLVEAGARVVWGHSPHHFLGVEWIGRSVVLYATGDLVDDYRLEPEYRNDRQLLFQVSVGRRGVEQVRVFPVELGLGRTRPAGAAARRWIADRFAEQCADLGSRVLPDGSWLDVTALAR